MFEGVPLWRLVLLLTIGNSCDNKERGSRSAEFCPFANKASGGRSSFPPSGTVNVVAGVPPVFQQRLGVPTRVLERSTFATHTINRDRCSRAQEAAEEAEDLLNNLQCLRESGPHFHGMAEAPGLAT